MPKTESGRSANASLGIDNQVNVLHQLVFVHFEVSDGKDQAQNLLHAEFDGTLHVFDLFIKVVSVSKQRREFASFVKTRSQKPGNLLDKRLGSQKCIVLLGELLDKFLLLVQLLQVVGAHVGNTRFLSLITMLLITKDADGEFWPWDVAQSTGKIMLQPKNVTTLKLLFI